MPYAPHSRSAVLLAMSIAMLAGNAAMAAAPDKLDKLVQEFSSISHDLQKLQATQAALVQQKAAIDAAGGDLAKRQDALSQHAQAYSQQLAEQKQPPDQDRSGCNNADQVAGKNAPQHMGGCAKAMKKLSKLSITVDAGNVPLETKQTNLDMDYDHYYQKANDWNVQERETVTSLNGVYRALNDWADQAAGLITSERFQDEVQADHAERYCPHHGLPDGTLSAEVLMRYATGADRCLKYVAAIRHAAHTGPG